MKIHGLNKTTLLDYPGRVAATIFTGGCNFRCPFCHNGELVRQPDLFPMIAEEEVLAFLRKRKGVLSGVCITGGEPTLQPDLAAFIGKIKDIGLAVKLDTNGYRPEVLKELLQKGLLDYVAMDIKNSLGKYALTAGCPKLDTAPVEESVRLIRESGAEYEFRTTVVKELHDASDFAQIGEWLSSARAYFLQAYRDNENVIQRGFTSYTKEELEAFLPALRERIEKVELRGID